MVSVFCPTVEIASKSQCLLLKARNERKKIIILKLKVFFLIKIESRGTEACSRLVFFPLLPVGSFQRVPAIFNISEFLFS